MPSAVALCRGNRLEKSPSRDGRSRGTAISDNRGSMVALWIFDAKDFRAVDFCADIHAPVKRDRRACIRCVPRSIGRARIGAHAVTSRKGNQNERTSVRQGPNVSMSAIIRTPAARV